MNYKTKTIVVGSITILYNIIASFLIFEKSLIMSGLNALAASIITMLLLGIIYKNDSFYIFKEIWNFNK